VRRLGHAPWKRWKKKRRQQARRRANRRDRTNREALAFSAALDGFLAEVESSLFPSRFFPSVRDFVPSPLSRMFAREPEPSFDVPRLNPFSPPKRPRVIVPTNMVAAVKAALVEARASGTLFEGPGFIEVIASDLATDKLFFIDCEALDPGEFQRRLAVAREQIDRQALNAGLDDWARANAAIREAPRADGGSS
jgi:hypothetical protein